jgi:tetratricopeptide (TPR) repeat protein
MPTEAVLCHYFLRHIFVILCIFTCLLYSVPASGSDDATRKMREAEAHFSRGEYLEALGGYQEVIEQANAGEHRPKALMMSAAIYGTFLKDHEAALKQYGQVRAKYPGSVYEADAIFQAAMIQYKRTRYREASRLFGI